MTRPPSSLNRPPGPREWIGREPFPWPAPHLAPVGELFHGCYYLVALHVLRTRTDKPFLRLQLQDVHGMLEARVWEMADEIAARLRGGAYVGVRGRLEVFNGERQLKVEEIEEIAVELEDLDLFLPRSRRDADEMDRELAGWIASVDDPALRRLLEQVLGPHTEIGAGFRLAPAAKYNHHAYLGGLIEHTLSIAGVCDALAEHYAPHVDRDLLITGALLHDLGKVREIGARAGFPYTDEGKLLGHIVIGMQMVADAARDVPDLTNDRLMLVQHLIASHQGRYEWQSPREPRTLEAMVLHYADDLDAKMQQALGLVESVDGGWSAYDRSLGREMFRHRPPGVAEPEPVYDAERPLPEPDVAAPDTGPPAVPEDLEGELREVAEGEQDEGERRDPPDTLDLFG